MQKNFYKNTFLSQLNVKKPSEILKLSIGKFEDVDFLNKLINSVQCEELYDFFNLLSTTTYNLNQCKLEILLEKHPLDKAVFLLWKSMNLTFKMDSKHFCHREMEFLLNYCYLREQEESYNKFELFYNIEPRVTYAHSQNELTVDFAIDRYFQILIKMFAKLNNSDIKSVNLESIKRHTLIEVTSQRETVSYLFNVLLQENSTDRINHGVLRSLMAEIIKDPLLKAILDPDARVNANFYDLNNLYFVPHNQIYNLCQKDSILLQLCQSNIMNGYCKICKREAACLNFVDNKSSLQGECSIETRKDKIQSSLEQKLKFNTPEFNIAVQNIFENVILENEPNFEIIHVLLLHCSWLRTPKTFKICLKMYISQEKREITKSIKKEISRSDNISSETMKLYPNTRKSYYIEFNSDLPSKLAIIDLFVIEDEIEAIAISFLKTASSYLCEALMALPFFMKSTKLYFACFIVLFEYAQHSQYTSIVSKNIINRYNLQFTSIINYILEYVINNQTDQKNEIDEHQIDKEYILAKITRIANLFSEPVEQFYNKNIYYIFNAFYPSEHFTDSFIQQNIRYIVIQNIVEGSFVEQIEDVDILVGLLFQDHVHFTVSGCNLDAFFKPSINFFIKKNLSHILFKIKHAYSAKLYNRKTCIFKIMKFILSQVNIPLYFSYIWPYVEFFLNKEYCLCAGYFLEWLSGLHNSNLTVPYKMNPCVKIEDIPMLPNIETKIYPILARFFSSEQIPFEYTACHFISMNNMNSGEKISKATGNSKKCTKTHRNTEIGRLYSDIKDYLLQYEPSSLIDDEYFIEHFISNFKNNKQFKSKISSLYSNKIPTEIKALFGNIRYDESVESFPRAPNNIPKEILESYLLKINYERQDLFAFTIQEFLKKIDEPFEPEIENFIQQFRHTKLEYKFNLKAYEKIDYSTYRKFLESLFYILYIQQPNVPYFKYLVLFDEATLEYACLCLTKLISNRAAGFCEQLYKSVQCTDTDVLKFLLKINTFVGWQMVGKEDIVVYSILARDFYSLIYTLEDTSENSNDEDKSTTSCFSERDLLQLAYFMIGDLTRVRGFNSTAQTYSTFNLFFDFIIDKKYKASRSCLDQLEKECYLNAEQDESIKEQEKNTTKTHASFQILKGVVECNVDFEIETMISGKFTSHPGVIYHILKDLELLVNSSNIRKTVDIIHERRTIAEDSYLILKIHKFIESKINIKEFSMSVDKEIIKHYIKKKEYDKAEEQISEFLLRRDYSSLYELALIKIATKQLDNAKDLLKRMQTQCSEYTFEYFKATVKLCEISPSKTIFENSVMQLEEKLCIFSGMSNVEGIELGDFYTQKTNANTSNNKLLMHKLESIVKDLEKGKNRKITYNEKTVGSECKNASDLDNLPATNSGSSEITSVEFIEMFKSLQKLYFLTAKYFEKHNPIISIKYYFKSFISNQEAIPRFFHLIANTTKPQSKIIQEMIDTIIKEYLPNLIPFYKQISTKIALDTDAAKFFKQIVYEMLEKYPYQTHWNTLFLYNSKKAEVGKIMHEMIEKLSVDQKSMFLNINNCSEKLTMIAKSQAKELSMANFPDVRVLFPAQINIPGHTTEINNIKNEILIFRSLQMPKKVTFVGEDGKDYPMIVKFKDDLRKDSRFMDLNELLNKLFDEGHYIRSYNVIPFTHESGIIEFLPNLKNLKEIVTAVHKNTYEAMQPFLKTKVIGVNNIKKIEKAFKPVFNSYLKDVYRDPYQFYKNRENYIKTYAIMNVVGWYMGLGDRHAENIHFDKITGDTVHVDLNCIFERGKALEIPESVPFRLTQNIVDGFGVLKLEGTYRNTMKYTLELLREHRNLIQANLLSFVFDPLFEWSRRKTEPSNILQGLDTKLDFEDIDVKIDMLINEAKDYNNLGSMYIGWMAFI